MSSQLPLGAVEKSDGSTVIPANRRPDGTLRKEIRIRKGYLPPDEQRKYVTPRRREHEKKEQKTSTTAARSLFTVTTKDDDSKMTKAQRKNKARKAKKSTEKAVDNLAESLQSVSLDKKNGEAHENSDLDYAKQVKKLRKKLKQIDELQSRIENDKLIPNEEQSLKLAQRLDIQKKLDSMLEQFFD